MGNGKRPENICYSFVVIGSGGTGTYFLKEFSRYLGSGVHRDKVRNCIVIDGDTVEEKNLARQAFTEDDIGMSKSSVMADVLNSSFGTDWKAYSFYLSKAEELDQVLRSAQYSAARHVPVLIGCVDNHAARLVLEEFFNKAEDCIYFDSANEYSAGEVVLSYKLDGNVISPLRSKLFPDILRAGKGRLEMSCEELNNAAPQHIATNMRAGNILLAEVCSLLDDIPHPGLVTFDIATLSQEFVPMNLMRGKKAEAGKEAA